MLPTVQIPVPEFQPHRWAVETLADPRRFQSICWHRRARKTTRGLNKLIRAACLHKNRLFGYIGPTYKQAKATVVKDPMMLSRYLPPTVLAKPFNETDLTATFRTGSVLFIKGADDPDSLRGIAFYGVVLDEWAMMKRAIFEEILAPTVRENGGWCDFQFTPKGRNHAWDYHRRGTLAEYPEWAAYTLPASQSGLLAAAELAKVRREMGDALYQQEMECAFLDDAQTVFAGLDLCLSGSLQPPREGRRYVMGIDLGRHHDATVLTVLDCATRHVVAWERMTQAHWALQKQAIAALSYQYHHPLCIIDATGFSAGDPIAEDLREMGLSVEGVDFTSHIKRSLVDGLRIAIADRLITFPPIPQLVTELRDFEMKIKPDGSLYEPVRYGAPEGEGYFDDAVISLALAVHGLKADLYVPRYALETTMEAVLAELPTNGGYGG